MIKIEMDVNALTMRVSGHAEYAEKGKDIVCAGVSALAFALIARAIDGALEGEIAEVDTRYGCAVLRINPQSTARAAEYRAAFGVIDAGFQLIAARYSDFVQMR